MENKIERLIVPINVFMFIKTVNESIEVACNLKIFMNCRRIYSFVFFCDTHSYSLFEMNDKLNVFSIKLFTGEYIIADDKNSFEEKLNFYIKNNKISDVNVVILDWIKNNYFKLNNIFPIRFGL